MFLLMFIMNLLFITKANAQSVKTAEKGNKTFSIEGVWQLTTILYGITENDMTKVRNMRQYKIMDKGIYYVVNIEKDNDIAVVIPHETHKYSFTNIPTPKYIENGKDMQLFIINDNTYQILWKAPSGDQLQTWKRVNMTDDLVKYMEYECEQKSTLLDMLDKNNVFK